jgi:hypothetical protein
LKLVLAVPLCEVVEEYGALAGALQRCVVRADFGVLYAQVGDLEQSVKHWEIHRRHGRASRHGEQREKLAQVCEKTEKVLELRHGDPCITGRVVDRPVFRHEGLICLFGRKRNRLHQCVLVDPQGRMLNGDEHFGFFDRHDSRGIGVNAGEQLLTSLRR